MSIDQSSQGEYYWWVAPHPDSQTAYARTPALDGCPDDKSWEYYWQSRRDWYSSSLSVKGFSGTIFPVDHFSTFRFRRRLSVLYVGDWR